jgi:hypothetical protein
MIACGIMGPISISLMLLAVCAGVWTYGIVVDRSRLWRLAVSTPLTVALGWLAMFLAAPLGSC